MKKLFSVLLCITMVVAFIVPSNHSFAGGGGETSSPTDFREMLMFTVKTTGVALSAVGIVAGAVVGVVGLSWIGAKLIGKMCGKKVTMQDVLNFYGHVFGMTFQVSATAIGQGFSNQATINNYRGNI